MEKGGFKKLRGSQGCSQLVKYIRMRACCKRLASKLLPEFPDTPSGKGHAVSYKIRVFIQLTIDPPLRSSQFFWAPNSKKNILTPVSLKMASCRRGSLCTMSVAIS